MKDKPTIRQCDCPRQCGPNPHKWRLWLMRYGESEITFEFGTWKEAMEYVDAGIDLARHPWKQPSASLVKDIWP